MEQLYIKSTGSKLTCTSIPGIGGYRVLKRCLLLLLMIACKWQMATAKQAENIARTVIKPSVDTIERATVLSLTAGTTGIGVEGRKLITDRLNLRAGFSFLPDISVVRTGSTDFDNTTKGVGNFSKANLLLEYAPFKTTSIRLVGGAGYIFQLKTVIDQDATGNYTFGDITFTPDEIGTIHTTADWKGFAIYGGLGFFKMVPQRRFNVTLDLGTYYLSHPKTSITATKLMSPNASESNQMHWHENISQYRWLPVLQVNFNFKISK